MYFAAATTVLALASLAAIPARGAVFNVTVGGPGILRYDPEFVTAQAGDQIVFTFKQKNHTITQSTFANPCSPAPGGFDSGFMPVGDGVTEGFPSQTVTVGDTNPIWIYCRQTGHCQQGMVFAVNPGDKFAAFQAAANATGSSTTTAPPSSTTDAGQTTPSVVTVTETLTVGDGSAVTTTYGSYPGSAQPTSATSTDHKIVVGGPNLVYNPSNITAQAGDTVTFQFMVKNHTATQSSFGAPCRPLGETSTTGQTGFSSGFMPVSANATDFPTFTITVNDTAPIWVYCMQANHCGQGMVFSVNAIESGPNNFAAFKTRAMQINGTSSSSTASGAGSSPTSSASRSLRVQSSAGAALAIVAFAVGSLL
ncbi:uncharacterized protein FOMMEDRAFT_18308 [Fomitiporia mediterranea MF3/22]|uniref:uncharacterized protein n=1 Tax=Fomitiporia mediterranea (strain MF3/22) TaxID=694068 RepID=UPI0004409BBE|nr:uncharacterized protein FOMMEDRAFT_18308 [Fomitiporia mediterranea MF3/22]EJD06125.1 hypothetical protein FOMMEDRAFT_18308 [Fomitiporia mediterranea MF3/22]